MRARRLVVCISLCLAFGLLAGCAVPSLPAGFQEAKATPEGAALAGAVTGTGIAADKSYKAPPPDMEMLRTQLAKYLEQQQGTYGIYVIDLASGSGVGINDDAVFPTASTFKLPVAMYILDLVERGQASLDEQLTYEPSDWEDGTGTLQESVAGGDSFSVRSLVELAIIHSDNIATNMLLRRFGKENVFAYMNSLGGKVTMFDEETVGTTPREMALYMQHARDRKAWSDPELRKFLLGVLANTEFDDRAAAGVPDGVKVAHKIGTLPGVVNDVAIVYAPRRTFIVSAFSLGVDDSVAPDVIAELTRQVYNFEASLVAGSQSAQPPKTSPSS